MYDRLDDLTTARRLALQDEAPTEECDLPPELARLSTDKDDPATEDSLTTTLPLSAECCFDLMCDVETTPEWLKVVRSVRVFERNRDGRPARAAFLANLRGASIGYSLQYRYWPSKLMLAWTTASSTGTQIAGRARFSALSARTCLLDYELTVLLPSGALPPWDDPDYEERPTWATVSSFRKHVRRQRRTLSRPDTGWRRALSSG